MTNYREIPKNKILEFTSTPGFKDWESFFSSDSITHPAKMNLNLLKWIIETYTKLGEVVLDPMAGTGSTIILAALLGRHGVAVEYESRFCDMIRANIELTKRQTTLTPKGRMICIQGDARDLSKLLNESDNIVMSPPFETTLARESPDRKKGYWKSSGGYQSGRGTEGYDVTEKNISNLTPDDIDTVVTSPPFSKDVEPHTSFRPGHIQNKRGYSDSKENIGNLKSETYLQAMLQVYHECYKVLKSDKNKLIVVVKNFIRDKNIVRLDLDTIKLCESTGFILMDHWYFKLPTRSFWRILYAKRFPDVPEVLFEDVLIFKRG